MVPSCLWHWRVAVRLGSIRHRRTREKAGVYCHGVGDTGLLLDDLCWRLVFLSPIGMFTGWDFDEQVLSR